MARAQQLRQVRSYADLERLVDRLWTAAMPTSADRTAMICGMVGYGMLLLGAQEELEQQGIRPYQALAAHPQPPAPYCMTYVSAAMARPHLQPHLQTIAGWADQPDDGTVRAMRQLASVLDEVDLAHAASLDAPVTAGSDLLGSIYTMLLSTRAKQGRETFYSPVNLAEMMGRMVLGTEPKEGERILDPACGSGVLLLAAAKVMREHGRDPATCTWTGIDIDPIACALFAVNAVVFDLGPFVTVVCGDALDPATYGWTAEEHDEPNPAAPAAGTRSALPAPPVATSGPPEQASLFTLDPEEDP